MEIRAQKKGSQLDRYYYELIIILWYMCCSYFIVHAGNNEYGKLAYLACTILAFWLIWATHKYLETVYSVIFMLYGVGSELLYILFVSYIYIGIYLRDSELEKIYGLMLLLNFVYLLGVIVCDKGRFKVWSIEEISKYSKLKSMHRILNLGLNVHDFIPCRTVPEIIYAYIRLGKTCTIRTDKLGAEQGSQLGFYKADNISLLEINKIADEIVKNKWIGIVSNGLKYDKYLRYNIVYKLDRNGDFTAEYSRKNVPLRHMYKYPETLTTITGSLNDDIRLWEVYKPALESDRVDLREIQDILRSEFLICLNNKLFGRYIEMSVYNTDVGPLKQNKVYWEI